MQGKRILVVDDEAPIRKFLGTALRAHGHDVSEAVNGTEGISMAATHRPDLVVLDLALPDMSGAEVLARVREWSSVPIIILTANATDAQKVALLDGGANDYVTKPFSIDELLARVRVALRSVSSPSDGPLFKSGLLEVDLSAHIVKMEGKEVKLTGTEFDLLRMLIQHAGKVVSQRQLLRDIWGPNAVEHSHYLRVYIAQLRKKLERGPAQSLITTEPGVGYRLNVLGPED